MKRALLVVAVLVACCGPPEFHRQEHQDEAVRLVWTEVYGLKVKSPDVQWIEGCALNCSDGYGWKYQYPGDAEACVGGLFFRESWLIQVAWPNGWVFSKSALAHELCHAYDSLDGRPADYEHQGRCFVPGGGLVELANVNLKAAGL